MGKTMDIGGRIHNPEVGNVVTGANEILDDTKNKKQDVINSEVDSALEALNANKQDNLTFDQTPMESSTNPVTSGGVYAADAVLQQAIEAILVLIPSAATALNQLADKSFVNSTVATNTATFRGTYNVVTDLGLAYNASHQDIATALLSHIATADNNDYAFVQIPVSGTSEDIRVTERYKFNGTVWGYEYDLNNSGFTAAQWAAINSGITALLVEKLGALPTAAELALALAGKQATLTFDNVPTSGSNNPVKSGGLYQLFTAIDAKMPLDASSSNKLVAENRLAAYVTAVIEAIDASFDLTSADGHVTFRMTQTNGVIASVQILTSDIASASQVSTNTEDIAALQALYNALQQSAPEIIQPTDTWPVANPSDKVIYRVIDRENTPPQYYSDYMWNGTVMVLMATYNNAIDAVPTAGSDNLVKSGGVYKDTNRFIFTTDGRLGDAIKDVYWDTVPSGRGYYLNLFGYYAASNWFYGQLYDGNGTLVGSNHYDFDSFDGHFVVEGLHVIVDKSKFSTQYQNVVLSSSCYLKTPEIPNGSVTSAKLAANSVYKGKIVDNAVNLQKLSTDLKINTESDITNLGVETENCFWEGSQSSVVSGWSYVTFNNVSGGDILEITAVAGQNARLWWAYNSSNVLLANSSDSSAVGEKTETVTLPSGTAYIIVNTRHNVGDTPLSVIKDDVMLDASKVYVDEHTSITEYADQQNGGKANILYGKTLVCCGDSITNGADMDAEGIDPVPVIEMYNRYSGSPFGRVTANALKSYGYQIAARNNMIFYNDGMDGSTMQGVNNGENVPNGFSIANGRYTTLPNDIDYLIIWFGWNDYGHKDDWGLQLGTINDDTNESYFGGYNVVLPYLINKYPYAKICLAVPFGMDENYRNAIRSLANKWGVACWDNYNGGTPLYYGKEASVGVNASIVTSNRQKFQANGAHPNYKGHRQLSNMIEQFLRGI